LSVTSASRLLLLNAMSANGIAELTRTQVAQTSVSDLTFGSPQIKVGATQRRFDLFEQILRGFKRRLARERRRRKVGRAYDMALEIARVLPRGAEVLDVGCGNGFIAHHLSAILGTSVVGIDVGHTTEAPIDFRLFDGKQFPMADNSVDAVLFCYVLHHAQDIHAMLNEARRVLRGGGQVVIYEDIPQTWWDKGVCWFHDRRWRDRTGPCMFLVEVEWRALLNGSGFEVCTERPLSRARNLTHPVERRLFVTKISRAEWPRQSSRREA